MMELAASYVAGSPPRVRGTAIDQGVAHDLVGSPPRVRGTVEIHHPGETIGGITPACAGNSGAWGAGIYP